jgi:hypothetical protein
MQLDLSLNPFIASHLPLLMTHIQELALCQYVVPFVSIRLQVLALRLPCPASSHASSSMTIVTAASGEMKCCLIVSCRPLQLHSTCLFLMWRKSSATLSKDDRSFCSFILSLYSFISLGILSC